TEYTFSKAPGADVNSNRIVNLKFINIPDGDFSYPVIIQPDEYFFNRKRATDRSFRPEEAYFQDALDQANNAEESKIIFFSKPDKTYQCTIKAKFVIDVVSLSQPLAEVPKYYFNFLKYALARSLNDIYPGTVWTDKKERKYIQLLTDITDASDINLETRTGIALKQNRRGTSLSGFLNGC
ncbi:unnamed protein product, partial [marine sediment metagenome]